MAEAKTKEEEEAVSAGLAVQCQLWVSAEGPEAAHFVTGDKSVSVCEKAYLVDCWLHIFVCFLF